MVVLVLALIALVVAGIVWFLGSTILDTFTPMARGYAKTVVFVFLGLASLFTSVFMFTTLRVGTLGMGFMLLALVAFGWAYLELPKRNQSSPDNDASAGSR